MATKGRSTQWLANTFPLWANIRSDEQSLGYQLLNSTGKDFDDLRKQTARIADNYFLPSSIVSDIDIYYQFRLPGDYEFNKEDDDETEFIYTPPTVSGLYDNTFYDVSIATDNDIESFWYTSIPDRITLTTSVDKPHLLASGYCDHMLFDAVTPSGELYIPNQVTVTISGSTTCVTLQDNNLIRNTVVQIEGFTREGRELTEELIFVHDDTQHTMNDFEYINASGLRVYGVEDPTETKISFTSGKFQESDYSVNYNLSTTQLKQDMPLFWAVGSGISSSTLDLKKYNADDFGLRVDGFIDKHVFIQQELLNTSSSTIAPLDLAVEPHSDNVWVVDSGSLYLYSADIPYPDMSQLENKDYEATAIIEPNTYYAVIDEEVEFNYIWRLPTKGMTSHRVWVQKPDGTKKSLESGIEITYNTESDSWIFGEPHGRQIRPTEFYTLNQRGDYIFSLETRYTDDSSSIDKRIVSVLYQEPLAQFGLFSTGITTTVEGIDFDNEYKMWILDTNGVKHQVTRHYDNMLIDFDRNVIYFRENYDQVRIYDEE